MTPRSIVLALARGLERGAPRCRCGLPLGPPHDIPATINHGPAGIRRCDAGHTVTVLPERVHGFHFPPSHRRGS